MQLACELVTGGNEAIGRRREHDQQQFLVILNLSFSLAGSLYGVSKFS